jgi:hypothetical protein
MDWAVLAWSIGAAVVFAVAAAFEHASVEGPQHRDRLSVDAVRQLVWAMVRQRLWWIGTAPDVVAACLHAMAWTAPSVRGSVLRPSASEPSSSRHETV